MMRYLVLIFLLASAAAADSRVFFEDFEDGDAAEFDYHTTDIVAGAFNGRYCSRAEWIDFQRESHMQLDNWSYSDEMLVRYMIRVDNNSEDAPGAKFMRLGFEGGDVSSDTYHELDTGTGSIHAPWFVDGNLQINSYGGALVPDAWNRYEVYIRHDTDGTDGLIRVWVNDELISNYENWTGDTFAGEYWYPLHLPSNWVERGPEPNYVYYDDIEIYSDLGDEALTGSMEEGTIDTLPQITSVTGDISNGANLTINGHAFGNRARPEPVRHIDFEGTTQGESIIDEMPYFTGAGGDQTIDSEMTRTAYSDRSGRFHMTRPGSPAAHVYKNDLGFGRKLYMNYWLWFQWSDNTTERVWGWGGIQYKSVYIMNVQDSYPRADPNLEQQFYWHPGPNSIHGDDDDYTYIFLKHNDGSGSASSICGVPQNILGKHLVDGNGAWFNIAIQLDQGDPNVSNGDLTYWISSEGFSSQYNNCSSHDKLFRINETMINATILGWYVANNVDSNEMTVYFDDIYMDDSWARVEIGDNESYDDCTHREIQHPHSTWQDDSIEITFNQGSFDIGDDAYLFVVDDDGIVSQGFPLTIAGTHHDADTDQDGAISDAEIKAYVQYWKQGSVFLADLISGLSAWKGP